MQCPQNCSHSRGGLNPRKIWNLHPLSLWSLVIENTRKKCFLGTRKKPYNWHFSIWIPLDLGEMRCRVRLLYFFFMLSKVWMIKTKANHFKLLIGMMGQSLDQPLCQLNPVTGVIGLSCHFACFLSSLLQVIPLFSVCLDFCMAYIQVTHVSWTHVTSSGQAELLLIYNCT